MSTSWLKGMPLDGKKLMQEAEKIAKALENVEELNAESDRQRII
jgi:hypothetical protein